MHENELFLLNKKLQPKGVVKWSPFDALDRFNKSIKEYDESLSNTDMITLSDEKAQEINLVLSNIKSDQIYEIKYYNNSSYITIDSHIKKIENNQLFCNNDLIIKFDLLYSIRNKNEYNQ